ncbi:MAG: hypothetical protein OXP66_16845, partial [Candidatus Tectomicrobia bacterium]|nr:hypothetical protein [Candidatus Tectomicrobia bacterium]
MWHRILVIAGGGLALLLIALGLVITAPPLTGPMVAPVRAWLVHTAAQRLSGGMNGTLELGVLEGSLLRAPRLSGVVLRDPTGAAVLRLDAVRLRYAPLSLLRGRLIIHELEVVGPFATVLQARDGTLNLARLAQPAAQPAQSQERQGGFLSLPFGIELRRLSVKDGGSRLALRSLKGVTAITDVRMALAGRVDDTGLHLTIQEFAARAHPAQVSLSGLKGAIRATASQLQIEITQAQTGNTQADLNLVLPRDSGPVRVAGRLNPLDMGEVGRLVARDDLRGQLHLDLRAQGPLDDIGFRADLSAAAGEVTLEGRLNTAESPPRYSGTASVRGFNLAALAEREALESDLNMMLEVEGRGLSPRTVEGKLDVLVQPSYLGDITLDASRIHISAKSERIHVEAFELASSLASVRATGSLDFRGVSDLVYEASADLSQLRPVLGIESLHGGLQLRGSAAGAWPDLEAVGSLRATDVRLADNGFQLLELDYQASQLGALPLASARLQMRNLAVGALPVETVEIQATYEGSVRQAAFTTKFAQLPEVEGRVAGRLTLGAAAQHTVLNTVEFRFGDRTWLAPRPVEIATGSGTLDIRSFRLRQGEESVSLTGRIQNRFLHGVRLEASSFDLTSLKSMLGLPFPPASRASLVMQAGGAFSDPVLRCNLRITPSTAEELPFDRLQGALRYEARELTGHLAVRQDDRDVLQLDIEAPLDLGLANIPPSNRLLDGPLNLSLRLRRPDLALLRSVLPAAALSGDLRGDAALNGTFAQLKLASKMELRNGSVEGVVEEVFVPVRMTGELTIADSVPLLAEALASNALTLRLRRLELGVSSAGGRLAPRGSDPNSRPVGIANVRLQGDATWSADGFEATVAGFQAEADAFGLSAALSASARLTGERLELRHLQVATARSRVAAKGHMTLEDRRFEL